MSDNHDFEFAQRGLLIPEHIPQIPSESDPSVMVWDSDAFTFLQADCPSTADKMLWRQGQLCSVTAGLYLVVDGIYQIRGLDISNMSIIRVPGTNQIVIVDCLTSAETAKRGLELYQMQHVKDCGKEADIAALFYTHSHGDHFGGSQAIVDKAGPDLRILAPDGFMEHAVSENIYAGTAMGRRSVYMYGQSLDKSPTGCIGCGLGQSLSTGTNTLVKPTESIKIDGPLVPEIPGLKVICQLTPNTEAPSEVNFFFPDYAALLAAENATHTMHNIQTLRGAQVRDARMWSRYLDEAIVLFGDKSQVVFASHHWPTWNLDGEEDLVVTFLSEQRDMYAYLHNETLRQMNNGKTPVEIAEGFVMPPSLATKTNLQGFYGSVNHNVKAVYDRYMGWFDGNPAHLHPHTPVDQALRYIDCMGGTAAAYQKANEYYTKGDLRFAATLLNDIVFADPTNADARNLLATVYTQIGQKSENGTWRNIYLVGAQELLLGPQPAYDVVSPEALISLSLDELFDTIAIRIDGPKAFQQTGVTIDFMIEDLLQDAASPGGGWRLRLSNSVVTGHAIPYVASGSSGTGSATCTVWMTHADLAQLVASASSGQATSLDGFTTVGDVSAWTTITSLITLPDTAFNIVTP